MLPPSEMGLDGLVSLEEKGFLVSSWGDSTVYWIQPAEPSTSAGERGGPGGHRV